MPIDFHINMALEFVLFILKIFFLSFLISLPFLYDLSARFRYHFKFFTYYSLFALANLLAPFVVWIWNPIHGSDRSMPSFLYRTVGHILNIQWKVIGEENLDVNQFCVVLANQQSSIDILGAFNTTTTSRKVVVIRQRSVYDVFGILARLTSINNPIFTCMKRDCKRRVDSTISKKTCVWFLVDEITNMETDIFCKALNENIPIVPVVFSQYYFLSMSHEIFDPGQAIIKILPSIRKEDYFAEDMPKMVGRVQRLMKNEYNKLSEKVRPLTVEELRKFYTF